MGLWVRLFPPPPKGFDPFTATVEDLKRHGLPLRPDTATAATDALTPASLPLDPIDSCGYNLLSTGPTIGTLFITWTVPDLEYVPSPLGDPNQFHTFVGLGLLDVHVNMTVDSSHNVTCRLWASGVGDINLPVRPGDVMSGSLCLETNPQGTAAYFLANETTGQTMNFVADTGFPPAVAVNAGVSRSGNPDQPPDFNPLARFGAVYFDEISVFTSGGPMWLTSGAATTMVNESGSTLATPARLNDYAFKVVDAAA